MGHKEQDILMRRYDQHCDVSTASLRHATLSPTTVMGRGRDAQQDGRRPNSVERWQGRIKHGTKINVILFKNIATRTHEFWNKNVAMFLWPQQNVQPWHR